MDIDLRIGGLVTLKKPHPCGEYVWEISRLGADIGLVCHKCKRHILVPRNELIRRIKMVNH